MDTQTFSVRVAHASDAEIIASVGAETFYDTFVDDNTPEDMAAYLAVAAAIQFQSDHQWDIVRDQCQALVTQVSEPAMRVASMGIGVRSARQAALMALTLNPGGFVSSTAASSAQPTVTTAAAQEAPAATEAPASDAPPLTEIPLPVAVPTQFGALSPITYIGGAGDENGVRLKLNLETPSLNSLAYTYTSCPG